LEKFLIISWICIFAVGSLAQTISPEIYQTEEDLLEGLQNGELSFDQYLELLDLIRQKPHSTKADSTLLLQIPDADYSSLDKENYDSQERVKQFLQPTDTSTRPLKGRVVLQHRQKVSRSSEPETYLRIQAENQDLWSFYLESENQDNQNRIKRRALEFNKPGHWKIVLGNFQPHLGLGVNLGYRSYLNFSSENSLEAENTFLFPRWTRYNGIFTNFQRKNISGSFFYSQNRFGSYRDQVWGASLKKTWRRLALSPIISYQEISKSSDRFISRAASLFAESFWRAGRIAVEFALTGQRDKGVVVEALWRQARKYDFQISYWSYSQDFLHPTSGGKALPDYRSMELENLDLTFRSRQAGETGTYFFSAISLNPRLKGELAYQQWRDGNSYLNKNKARLGLGYWLRKNLETKLKQYWEDDNLGASFPGKRTTALVTTYLFSKDTRLQFRLNYRVNSYQAGNEYSTFEEVLFYLPLKERLWSKFRVRYRDPELSQGQNSSWDFYLSESIIMTEKILLTAEFISKEYQEQEGEDFQVLRVRVEWSL